MQRAGLQKGAVDDELSSHAHKNTHGVNRLNVKTFNRPRCEQLIVSEFWFLLCHTVRLSARRPRLHSASTAAQSHRKLSFVVVYRGVWENQDQVLRKHTCSPPESQIVEQKI